MGRVASEENPTMAILRGQHALKDPMADFSHLDLQFRYVQKLADARKYFVLVETGAC